MSIAQQVGHCKVSQGRKIKSLRKVSLTRRGVQGILCAAFMPIVGHAANLYWDGTNTNNPLIGWNDITSWSTVNNATTPDPFGHPRIARQCVFQYQYGERRPDR